VAVGADAEQLDGHRSGVADPQLVLLGGHQGIGVGAVGGVDVAVGDVHVRGQLAPDHRAVALRVAVGQAHVLVEQDDTHAREGQPVVPVPADQLLVGQHR
jgi:hypothetical protein